MSAKIGRPISRPESTPDQDTAAVSRSTFAQNYPSLFRFLSEVRETSNFHKTGSVSVFWESGVFKVCLNDRPEYRSTFVSAQTLGETFLIADRGIRSRTLRWRKNRHKSNGAQ